MALVACSGSPSRVERQRSTKSRESPACRGTVTALLGLESHHASSAHERAELTWRGTVAHATAVPACCHLPKLVDTVSWGGPDRRPPPHPSPPAPGLLQHIFGEHAGSGTAWARKMLKGVVGV